MKKIGVAILACLLPLYTYACGKSDIYSIIPTSELGEMIRNIMGLLASLMVLSSPVIALSLVVVYLLKDSEGKKRMNVGRKTLYVLLWFVLGVVIVIMVRSGYASMCADYNF